MKAKPVEVKPLVDDRKDVAACVPLSVRVSTGVQTDESCAAHVSVHTVPRVGRCFLRTSVRHFVATGTHRRGVSTSRLSYALLCAIANSGD